MSGKPSVDWSRVAALYSPGDSVNALHRRCKVHRVAVSRASIAIWLRDRRGAETPSSDAPPFSAEVEAASEDGDLDRLRALREVLWRDIQAISRDLDPRLDWRAARTRGQLLASYRECAKAIDELSPRVDTSLAHLEALGEEGRATLIARCEAVAVEDERLRIIVGRLQERRRRCTCRAFEEPRT